MSRWRPPDFLIEWALLAVCNLALIIGYKMSHCYGTWPETRELSTNYFMEGPSPFPAMPKTRSEKLGNKPTASNARIISPKPVTREPSTNYFMEGARDFWRGGPATPKTPTEKLGNKPTASSACIIPLYQRAPTIPARPETKDPSTNYFMEGASPFPETPATPGPRHLEAQQKLGKTASSACIIPLKLGPTASSARIIRLKKKDFSSPAMFSPGSLLWVVDRRRKESFPNLADSFDSVDDSGLWSFPTISYAMRAAPVHWAFFVYCFGGNILWFTLLLSKGFHRDPYRLPAFLVFGPCDLIGAFLAAFYPVNRYPWKHLVSIFFGECFGVALGLWYVWLVLAKNVSISLHYSIWFTCVLIAVMAFAGALGLCPAHAEWFGAAFWVSVPAMLTLFFSSQELQVGKTNF